MELGIPGSLSSRLDEHGNGTRNSWGSELPPAEGRALDAGGGISPGLDNLTWGIPVAKGAFPGLWERARPGLGWLQVSQETLTCPKQGPVPGGEAELLPVLSGCVSLAAAHSPCCASLAGPGSSLWGCGCVFPGPAPAALWEVLTRALCRADSQGQAQPGKAL